MREELLHYIWQQKTLLLQPLETTSGEPITVVKTGLLNHNAGPDFFDARIKIGDTLWAGNVEFHLKSSDWFKHKHQLDDAYKNVILHVVFEHDTDVGLPTLELKKHVSLELINTYTKLQKSALKVPCQNQLVLPDGIKLNQYIYRLAVERLEDKCALLEKQLLQYNNSWEKLFYVVLAKYFGMKINAAPFVQLAENLPAQLLAKHKHSQAQIDALIFGVAGFLPCTTTHHYMDLLNQEFSFLQHKYNLPQVQQSSWKFAKTRPANFPTVRLALFSSLVFQSVHLFSKLMAATNINEAQQLLAATINPNLVLNYLYAANHTSNNAVSKLFIQHLIVNAVVPLKFVYGKHLANTTLCEQATDWLEQLLPEKNSIVSFWQLQGVKVANALHTQALIQLNNNYCASKKCLSCAIGNAILNSHV